MPDLISPYGVILFRVLIAVLLFWVISFFLKKEPLERKDIGRVIACSILGTSINILLFYKGLSITTPINATLVMTTTPILVLIVSAIIAKEKITWSKIVGIILGLTGVLLLTTHQWLHVSSNNWLGDIMIFFNAISYGVYLVIAKPLFLKYHPITIFKWMFLMSLLMVWPFGISDVWSFDIINFPIFGYEVLLYIGVAATVVTFTLNAWALKRINPSLIGIYIYMQPVVASVIAIVTRAEVITATKVVVAGLVFVGVYLVGKKEKRVS